MFNLMYFFTLLVAVFGARRFSDEEYCQLPKLYHLDDYEQCLSKLDGLYCLGSFQLTGQGHPSSDLMKEYSNTPRKFNRTYLHRGYCVSARCPSSGRNTTRRFERCVQRTQGSQFSLKALSYCHTHEDSAVPEMADENSRFFAVVIVGILLLNAFGTAIDVLNGCGKKSQLAMIWSVKDNWKRLVHVSPNPDPNMNALGPISGFSVLLEKLVIIAHVYLVYHMAFVSNPRFMEGTRDERIVVAFETAASVVQMFLMMSAFFYAYAILNSNKSSTWATVAKDIVKRAARTGPLHILGVAFAATWWSRCGGGPMWPVVAGPEINNCRETFWLHTTFLNNVVNAKQYCLIQTWYVAADMQLFIVVAILTHLLSRRRNLALHILGSLLLATCAVNAGLAYRYQWKSVLFYVNPETLRSVFLQEPSFTQYYVTPQGSLAPCILGLILAYLQFELKQRGYKASEHTGVVILYHLSVPLFIVWVGLGVSIREIQSPSFVALYVALDRPLHCMLAAAFLFGLINGIESPLRSFLSWRGWQLLARLSYGVFMLHWTVVVTLVAMRTQPVDVSKLQFVTDLLSTTCWSYALAVPATVLVEIPFRRTVAHFIA